MAAVCRDNEYRCHNTGLVDRNNAVSVDRVVLYSDVRVGGEIDLVVRRVVGINAVVDLIFILALGIRGDYYVISDTLTAVLGAEYFNALDRYDLVEDLELQAEKADCGYRGDVDESY